MTHGPFVLITTESKQSTIELSQEVLIVETEFLKEF